MSCGETCALFGPELLAAAISLKRYPFEGRELVR